MKPCLNFGACSAFWTWYGDGELNHEIDIELPGHKGDKIPSFELMLNNTWKIESKHEKNCTSIKNANDGEYHKFRFDWHTEPARVEFYYDDELVCVNTTEVPTIKSNVFIAVWFPNGWAGEPNFEKGDMRVKYFKYHPFLEKCENNKIDIFTDMTRKIAS